MRVTVTPINYPQEALVLIDGALDAENTSWPGVVLNLAEEPLKGWHEGVSPRAESPDIPTGDGNYYPGTIRLDSRVVTLRGIAHVDKCCRESTVGLAAFDDFLAALIGEPILFEVEDASGLRWSEGYVSSIPKRDMQGQFTEIFTLIISMPDPLKYGRAAEYGLGPGLNIEVQNAGTGQVFPVIRTTGSTAYMQATFGGRVVRWEGGTLGMEVNLRDLLPVSRLTGAPSGVMVRSEAFRIPHGTHVVTVSSNADVSIEVTPGWK